MDRGSLLRLRRTEARRKRETDVETVGLGVGVGSIGGGKVASPVIARVWWRRQHAWLTKALARCFSVQKFVELF